MIDWRSPGEWKQLFRYYQAGVVNTLFGYGLFALFIAGGMNMYVAQALSHVAGVTFNYFTYSRYAFSGQSAAKHRFVISYVVNYFLGLVFLTGAVRLGASAYLAGLVSTILVSAINYLALRGMVFRTPPP